MTVYNIGEVDLDNCLRSVTLQSLRSEDLEVVCVDDASDSAETREVLRRYEERVPQLRVVRHQQHRGPNAARATGVAESFGEFVMFVDGDDMITRDSAESLLLEARRSEADIVTAPFYRWDAVSTTYQELSITNLPYPEDLSERVEVSFTIRRSQTMCGRLFSRELLTPDVFDLPEMIFHEDLVTVPRIVFKAKKIVHISRFHYYYNDTAFSITKACGPEHVAGLQVALDEWSRFAHSGTLGDVDPSDIEDWIYSGISRLLQTLVLRVARDRGHGEDERRRRLQSLRDFAQRNGVFERVDSSSAPELAILALDNPTATDDDTALDELESSRPLPTRLPRGLQPTNLAQRLVGKVVLVCQVDYQVRSAALLATELRKRGHRCAILDNSAFTAGGRRQTKPEDKELLYRTDYIRIPKGPYEPDYLATAKFVAVYNDFNDDFREALEYRNRLNLPTACIIEGINDFLRVDTPAGTFLPYRRCEHVLLAGEDDRRFFEDRQTHVIGLPIIDALSQIIPVFPEPPLIALNLNFSYGILEDCRDDFLMVARAAFLENGLDWAVTQHPMDRYEGVGLPIVEESQYELIDRSTVFVSRFGTGILEALASGKAAIYLNPHGEKVDKFTEPMGAYEIATTVDELSTALLNAVADADAGVDFRMRAEKFLQHHTGWSFGSKRTAVDRFADAVIELLEDYEPVYLERTEALLDLMRTREESDSSRDPAFIVEFDKSDRCTIGEEEVIAHLVPKSGLLIDVGANHGNSVDIYLGMGWTVHAFEPDPANRAKLEEALGDRPNLIINDEAVSDVAGLEMPFFTSDVSTGISGLSSFHDSHQQTGTVITTTIDEYSEQAGIEHVDFLKIDVEGYDKFVLDGVPWDRLKPDVVLAEYEDRKTEPLGYRWQDIAGLMTDQGYVVYISEWFPLEEYGRAHSYRGLRPLDMDLDLGDSWGNLIGFLNPPSDAALRNAALSVFRLQPLGRLDSVLGQEVDTADKPRRWYADSADRLRHWWPGGYQMAKHMKRDMVPAVRKRDPKLLRLAGYRAARRGAPGVFYAAQPLVWSTKRLRRSGRAATSVIGFGALALGLSLGGASKSNGRTRLLGRLMALGGSLFVLSTTVTEVTKRIEEIVARDRASLRREIRQLDRDLSARVAEQQKALDDHRSAVGKDQRNRDLATSTALRSLRRESKD